MQKGLGKRGDDNRSIDLVLEGVDMIFSAEGFVHNRAFPLLIKGIKIDSIMDGPASSADSFFHSLSSEGSGSV